MKIIKALTLIPALVLTTVVYAEKEAPDELVTKSDINKCLEHLRNTEDFLYPHSLKVESAHYTQDSSKILLTLGISQKTEYGGNVGVQEKQCVIEKFTTSYKENKQRYSSKKESERQTSSYSYEY